jgi:hypothetical protein
MVGSSPGPSKSALRKELASISRDLRTHYSEQLDAETVRRTVYETYRRIAEQATVTLHLIPLTRNEARKALDALTLAAPPSRQR